MAIPIKAPAPTKREQLPIRILIIDAGWVVIGRILETPDYYIVVDGAVIRQWGTSRGVGQLALSGPTSTTILDPLTRTYVTKSKVMFNLNVTHKQWWNGDIPAGTYDFNAPPADTRILVIDGGWVLAGQVTTTSDQGREYYRMSGGSVVRRWGTEKGLGELGANGPRPSTELDDLGEALIPVDRTLMLIDVTGKWI